MLSKAPGGGGNARKLVADYLGLLLVLVALILTFGACTKSFLTMATFNAVASQVPSAVVIAVGMTFVLIIAGIDLSVGSVAGLSGAVLGLCMGVWKWPLPAAAAACLAVGLVCGLLNGAISTKWRVPSFIVTLGMLEAARGGAYLVSGSRTQYIGASVEPVANTFVLGVSLPFVIAILIVAAGQVLLTRTRFGRHALAVGANEQAARLSGIDPARVKLVIFALCGALVGVGALIDVSRLASADPNAGTGFELQAIAAVVIGGTSLMGGRGSVVSSFFGVLIIAVLGAGLAQMGTQEPTKRLITGCVIVLAVILDTLRQRRRSLAQ